MTILIIGIAGASGSGKTTLAAALCNHYGAGRCTIISSDNYYRDFHNVPAAERAVMNFDHPDSIDFALLKQHLTALRNQEAVEMPIYDFTTHLRSEETVTVSPQPVIIVEGILIQHSLDLCELYDTTIFVDTELTICLSRRLQRDVNERGRTKAAVLEQYQNTVEPMYHQFVAPCRERADMVVENNGEGSEVNFDITPLVSHLNSLQQKESKGQARFKLFAVSSADQPSPSFYIANNSEEKTISLDMQ